ncbi:hypothetical protein GRJ2_000504600 [Grus japonensis]|uniref:Uncharacterized protein n=1 Tax=Grus japonensis TaxID=30415 RepID=A0ABC9W4C7_GRUJA
MRRCRTGIFSQRVRDALGPALPPPLRLRRDRPFGDPRSLRAHGDALSGGRGEVECQKGSLPAMAANRSDNWDDEDAEDDGHMFYLLSIRVKKSFNGFAEPEYSRVTQSILDIAMQMTCQECLDCTLKQ